MEDASIVLCGEAGQGIQTVEALLAPILNISGYNVFSTKEYMSRIRGGSNSTEIRVSGSRVAAYVDRIDILIPLDKDALAHLKDRIENGTVILGEKSILGGSPHEIIDVPFSKIASELGGAIYANIIAVGLISRLFNVEQKLVEDYVKSYFAKKPADVISKNVDAIGRGYGLGAGLAAKLDIKIQKDPKVAGELMMSGADAVALGAIAGGCDFVSAYPMTPSTGVFTFLAKHARELGIVVEQAEDEIAAVNMALGAWYAGARAFVTTSGGGFALMVEGLSLSGALETPVVILLSQRPGPATGLPTRTEQGDLEFALYSGHGEFPRILLSPGTVEDAYEMSRKAFELADRHQSPVIILTDQYLVDSYYNIPSLKVPDGDVAKNIVETKEGYRRYEVTADGISPRGVPGYGGGLVKVDSDEHDEWGRITEDRKVRNTMVQKRLAKMKGILADCLPPRIAGPKDYTKLVVCWGSTFPIVKEAVDSMKLKDTAVLYFQQVYPIHPDTAGILKKARKKVMVENNATSQFGKLLRLSTGVELTDKVLKYDGLPFSVEELVSRLGEALK